MCISTLYNVCSVHREMFNTSGGVQYIGGISWVHRGISWVHRGISWVHRGMFSTSGDVQYIGGCSVHRGISWWMWGDTMSTLGDVQYIGGIPWVHRGDIMSTSGNVQYIGGISWYMWGSNLIKSFQFLLKTPMYWTSPNVLNMPRCTHDISPMYSWYPPDVLMISPRCTHGIPQCTCGISRCTEHPPMYSWYPPTCIMISPQCTEHPLMYSWYPPDVLMISPRCSHDIPPMFSWYPPDVLMVSPYVLNTPRCTEHPPMYWTSPDVLNTHYTGWYPEITIFFKFWHQQVYLRSGNLVLWFKNLMSLTQAIIQVGPHFQTTKWQENLFPNPLSAFKMNCITHIWLLWAWRHTCTLSGLPLSRQYEIPLLFQTKIRLYREAETKIFKIRIFNLAENEFQTTKSPDFFLTFGILSQIPWLFKVFQVSRNPALLSLLPMSENLAWIMWMDWNKYLIIGVVICYEYLNIWLIKNLLLATPKNWF